MRWLLALFPEARIVHVTRDPRAVLASLDAWERSPEPWARRSTVAALGDWVRTNRDLPALAPRPPQLPPCAMRTSWSTRRGGRGRSGSTSTSTRPASTSTSSRYASTARGRAADASARCAPGTSCRPTCALLEDPELRGMAAAYGYAL